MQEMEEQVGQPLLEPDRRRGPRMNLMIPVSVRVLQEEDTFSPFFYSGQMRNVSESGMLIEITDMPESHYKTLIHKQRLVRIGFTSMFNGKHSLFGKIVWFDYRRTSRSSILQAGVCLEIQSEHEKKSVQDLLAAAGDSLPGAADSEADGCALQ